MIAGVGQVQDRDGLRRLTGGQEQCRDAAFQGREWVDGAPALARYRGTATELGAVDAFLAARPGWDATVLRCAAAQPGGPMEDAAFAAWMDEVEEGLAEVGDN